MSGHWQGSTRRARLPANWPAIRAHVLERDNHRCQTAGCNQRATDVDHIRPGAGDTYGNLQALCREHHKKKSAAEGTAARHRFKRQRTSEAHPGRTIE